MKIICGNIKLEELNESKIEQLRIWRNRPENNTYLQNKKTISKKAQQQWFNKIKLSGNLYFIICYDEKEIGLIYTSKTNKNDKIVETNILIGEEAYKKSGIALKCSLIFTNYLLTIGGFKLLNSIVHKMNNNGLILDQFIGFEQYDESKDFIYLSLKLAQFKSSKGYELYTKIIQLNAVQISE